jgi:hypothetical protein
MTWTWIAQPALLVATINLTPVNIEHQMLNSEVQG